MPSLYCVGVGRNFLKQRDLWRDRRTSEWRKRLRQNMVYRRHTIGISTGRSEVWEAFP